VDPVSAVTGAGSRLPALLVRWGVLAVAAAVALVPLLAMADFSTRTPTGGRTGQAWASLATDPDLSASIVVSLELAVITAVLVLVLLLPTMLLVALRLPWARRPLELVCLLPLAVPAVVVVVGVAPVYAWVVYLLGSSPLTLAFAYAVLALPYAHRALDAGLGGIDLRTLTEASRSLGARWPDVVLRVVLPNLGGAVASTVVLVVAVVLGEFTVASLLGYDTLPVVINLVGKRDAGLSVAASLASLLLAFVLLLGLSLLPSLRRRRSGSGAGAAEPVVVAPVPGAHP
jgi:putative spermidine/putrescine transport system permease protein